jgi:hypothetical protein
MVSFPWTRKQDASGRFLACPNAPAETSGQGIIQRISGNMQNLFKALRLPHREDATSIEKNPRILTARVLCLMPEEPGPFGCSKTFA